MKLLSLILELTKHVIQIRNENRSDTLCWKTHVMCAAEKLNRSNSLENDNMPYVSFKIRE